MINHTINVLAIIPARGGSKGIPGKNIKSMAGKPLIQHTIDLARSCKEINRIVVSTDDEKIQAVCQSIGTEVILRPNELSSDTSLVIDAIKYTVNEIEKTNTKITNILLLEPTAPLRTISDIEQCIDALQKTGTDSVATFSQSRISPNRLWSIKENQLSPYLSDANPWLPRQRQPQAYELNGLVYGFTCNALKKNTDSPSLLMGKIYPVITDHHVIDIDDLFDWFLVEKIIEDGQI